MGITNSMSEANHRYMLSQLKCFLFEEVGDPNFLIKTFQKNGSLNFQVIIQILL